MKFLSSLTHPQEEFNSIHSFFPNIVTYYWPQQHTDLNNMRVSNDNVKKKKKDLNAGM